MTKLWLNVLKGRKSAQEKYNFASMHQSLICMYVKINIFPQASSLKVCSIEREVTKIKYALKKLTFYIGILFPHDLVVLAAAQIYQKIQLYIQNIHTYFYLDKQIFLTFFMKNKNGIRSKWLWNIIRLQMPICIYSHICIGEKDISQQENQRQVYTLSISEILFFCINILCLCAHKCKSGLSIKMRNY